MELVNGCGLEATELGAVGLGFETRETEKGLEDDGCRSRFVGLGSGGEEADGMMGETGWSG